MNKFVPILRISNIYRLILIKNENKNNKYYILNQGNYSSFIMGTVITLLYMVNRNYKGWIHSGTKYAFCNSSIKDTYDISHMNKKRIT